MNKPATGTEVTFSSATLSLSVTGKGEKKDGEP